MKPTFLEWLLQDEQRAVTDIVELHAAPRVGGFSVTFKGRDPMFRTFCWEGFMPCWQGITDGLLELQRRAS